jgi:hypothetical protein
MNADVQRTAVEQDAHFGPLSGGHTFARFLLRESADGRCLQPIRLVQHAVEPRCLIHTHRRCDEHLATVVVGTGGMVRSLCVGRPGDKGRARHSREEYADSHSPTD